jgi:hypothetical protein
MHGYPKNRTSHLLISNIEWIPCCVDFLPLDGGEEKRG